MPTVLRGIVKWSRPIYGSPYFGQDHLTGAEGMFGLRGFTVIVPAEGEITRSISSGGTAPNRTESPMTNAPVKQVRFANRIWMGPT
jgi:hypothetical protein